MAKATVTDIQTRARLLYEKDKLSMREIAERTGKAERTIANWAERGLPTPIKGPWVKGAFAEKVQEKREETILATAERLGLTSEFILTTVKTMLTATKPILVKPNKAEQDKAKGEGDESGGGFVTEVPDYSAIDAGLTHAERIIPGLKAKETLSVDFPAEMLAFFQGDK